MAYGLKYTLEALSKRYANSWKLKVYFDDYAGAEISRDIPVSGLVFLKDNEGLLKKTSVKFSIRAQADFDFIAFYTSDAVGIKCELLLSDVTMWTGFLNPEQFSEPYIPPPFNSTFVATDGLGRLKELTYTATNADRSQLYIIDRCLAQLGQDLGFSIAIKVHDSGMDNTRAPLAQAYVYDGCYNGMICYDVVADILQLYDARITQIRNRWFIWSDIHLGETRLLYNSSLGYEDTETAPAQVELGYPDADIYPNEIMQASLLPALKDVAVEQTLGYDGNLLENGDFSGRFSKADLLIQGWTAYNMVAANIDRVYAQNKWWIKFVGYQSGDYFLHNIEQNIAVVNDPYAGGFVLSFDVCFLAWHETAEGLREVLTGAVRTYRVMVTMTDGVNTKYLDETGWVDTVEYLAQNIDSSPDVIDGTEVKIITNDLPYESGTLKVRLYGYRALVPEDANTIVGMYYSNVRAYFLAEVGEEYPASLEGTFVINALARQSASDIELITGDAIDIPNKALYYKNKLMLSDDTPTMNWTISGKAISQSIALQMIRMIASRHYSPRLKLDGKVVCDNLDHTALVTHPYNSNIVFEIDSMEYDLYLDEARVALIERKVWHEYERYLSLTDTAISWAYDDAEAEAVTRIITTTITPWIVTSKPAWVTYKVLNASDEDITSTPALWISGSKLKVYPGSTNTGSLRSGTVYLGDAEGVLGEFDVSQAGSSAPTATIEVNENEGVDPMTITDESASISLGSSTLSYGFTPQYLHGSSIYVSVLRNSGLDASELLTGCASGIAVVESIGVTEAVTGDAYEVILSELGYAIGEDVPSLSIFGLITMLFDADGVSVRDNFKVKVGFAAQVWSSLESNGSWFNATPTNGTGDTWVTITCYAQNLGEQPERSGTLKIRSAGCSDVVITITQAART